MSGPRPLKVSEVAEMMGVSVSSIKRYIANGHLRPLILPGGHRRIPVEQIEECFEQAGKRRKKAPSPRKPHRPAEAATRTRAPRKPRRERRPNLGSAPPPPVYDTSDAALAEIRAKYEGLTAWPAA